MKGYMNKIVKINLSSGVIEDYPITDKDRKLYLGGKILAGKIIYDNITTKIDAFDSDNMIVITTSPLTNSTAACSSRFNVSTISPQTGLLASSNCGGSFGMCLKRAGYDGLIIVGKADKPTLIDINEDNIQLVDASHLWGMTTSQTQEAIGGKTNGKFVIGPAGENMVLYAGVVSQERTAGRAGVGAVFGSKNLKGLVATGNKAYEYHNKDKFFKLNKKWITALKKHPLTGEQLPTYGTAGLVSGMQYRHLLATKNYSKGQYQDFDKINGETLTEKYLVKNKGCMSCPIQCGRVVKVDGVDVKGPEVESITLLGSNLENSDMQNILDVNYLCDEYGLDTISFGSSVGFAMELNERGLWDNGLKFGDNSQLKELVKLVATRQGIGADIANGTRKMAQKYGGEEYAINVKGLELAAYEPRAAQGMGLGYATANRGGCHLNAGYMVVLEGLGLMVSGSTSKGKAAFTVFFQNLMEAISAGGSCLFTSYAVLPGALISKPNSKLSRFVAKAAPHVGGIIAFADKHPMLLSVNLSSLIPHTVLINHATGMKLNIGKYLKIGIRGYNIERMMNIRLGLTADQDKLPRRLTHELEDKNNLDTRVKLEEMKQRYYNIRGWDANGIPTAKTLKKYGIAQ